jgi:GAF domain-containing protein/CheY-like chemotaxis protein/anti-sigma regulatory factor (Ser/Thr protein kinase)
LLVTREECEELIRNGEVEELRRAPPKSWLGAPLKADNRVLGALVVESYTEKTGYSKADKDLLVFVAQHIATALERARLIEDTRQRNAELTVISSVQQALATELDMQVIYDLVGDQIRDIFDAQVVSIATFDHKAEREHFRYLIEKGKRYYPKSRPLEDVRRHLIRTRQLVLINEDYRQAAAEFGMRVIPGTEAPKSLLFVPLVVGETVIGYVSLQNVDREHAFKESDVRLLSTLAASMSVALENARLFEAERAQAERQAALFRLSAAIAAALDEDDICRALVDGLRDEALGYTYVAVLLLDKATGDRVERARTGWADARGVGLRLPPGKGLSEQALLDGQLHYTPDVTQAESYVPALATGSEVDVPIKIGGELVGVLVVESDEPNAFDHEDFDVLISAVNQMGLALGQARSLMETRQRVAELATVNSVGRAIGSQLDLDALIDLVGDQIRRTFAADIAYLALYDRQTGMIHFPYEYGDETPSRPFGNGMTERIIESRQALLINRNVKSRQAELKAEKIGIMASSYLGVPIMVGREAIGVVSVQSTTQEGRFDEANKNLLSTIAANVGAAIHNAQLYQETQRRAEEMAVLAEVGNDIAATLDLPTVLERIASHARNLLAADNSAVYLTESGDQTLRAIVAQGDIADEIKADPVRLGEGIIGDLAQRKAAEVINDANSDPRAMHIPGTPKHGDERLMATPLLSGGRLSGIMAVWRTGPGDPFTEADLRFLEGLARQGAIAIGNAHLFEQAQEAQTAAERANKAKSVFLANMSHELRTPLNAIIGFTRIVMRRGTEVLPEKQIENLDKVLVSAEHLLGLINTILDIAKIEAGHLDVQPGTFDAESLVDVCLTTTQPMVESSQVSLVREVAPDLPPVYSDQDKVKQVLLNLLSNAAKFTHKGQIAVRARRQQHMLIFDISDTGIGISEEDLARIFEEFQQVDISTTRQYGGTGLGLPISRSLARLLGGDLTASSTEGVGSTFTLTIPLHYGVEETSGCLQLPRSNEASPVSPSHLEETKPVVLAIDDDPDVIYLLQENLGEAGYQVVGALGGGEGVKKARQLRPFAITLDILMPDKDGWQVLHDLKTDAKTRHIPIIVLSIVDKKDLGYRLGAADYLVKPLDIEAVKGMLARLAQANGGVSPKRLLVVDDDPQVIDMVCLLLEETTYEVEGAEDGEVALQAIARQRPDAILLDLVMPRLDGFGVIEQLRQDPIHQTIPIVVLTAKTPTNVEDAHLKDHVSRVMHKQGLDGDTLLQELQQALSGLGTSG